MYKILMFEFSPVDEGFFRLFSLPFSKDVLEKMQKNWGGWSDIVFNTAKFVRPSLPIRICSVILVSNKIWDSIEWEPRASRKLQTPGLLSYFQKINIEVS